MRTIKTTWYQFMEEWNPVVLSSYPFSQKEILDFFPKKLNEAEQIKFNTENGVTFAICHKPIST